MTKAKESAAIRAAAMIESGMVVGLGTGSTAAYLVEALGRRVRDEGLSIRGVPTSTATRDQASKAGIPLVGLDDVRGIDLTVDGADEIGPGLALLKGGGGALLWEKIVAAASRRMIVIADAGKVVPKLGKFPLPVEVMPLGWTVVSRKLESLGGPASLRVRGDGTTWVTDGGHWILDARFGTIDDPRALASTLDGTVGVVEHGLFVGMASLALIGNDDGSVEEITA